MTEPPPPDRVDDDAVDVSLMNKVAQGDHAAFEELVTRHQNAVVGTVAKMLGSASDSEDIAQQVFLRLWGSAPRYKPSAKFTTFLFTITRNLVFNETRRKQRRNEHSLDEQEDDWHQQIPDASESQPDAQVLHAEVRRAVEHAIAGQTRLAETLVKLDSEAGDVTIETRTMAAARSLSPSIRSFSSVRSSLML